MSQVPPVRRLYWDIETSPNIGFFWKAGYKLNIQPDNIIQEKAIICICYKWEGQNRVYSLMWDEGDDKAMIEAFIPIMEQADELVAHNGDRFDIKWFNSQCLKHGLVPPLQPKTIDTLLIARRRFYLNSNRLDYLGKFLFGEGKIKTEFGMWKAIVLDNCPTAMRKMVDYCKGDVRLLERIHAALMPYAEAKSHAGVMAGLQRWTCAHCASKNVRRKKRRVTARGTVQHSMVCNACHLHFTCNDAVHRAWLEHKDDVARREQESVPE